MDCKNIYLFGLFMSVLACGVIVAEEKDLIGKDVKCKITKDHAHKYITEDGFVRYEISEKLNLNDSTRTDDYIILDKRALEQLSFANKRKLYEISENQEKIEEIISSQKDYTEYKYNYDIGKNRKDKSIYIEPAELVEVDYMYYGYKIINNKGQYELVQSEMYDNFGDIPEDYTYIGEDFYQIVKTDTGIKVNYTPTQEEVKEIIESQSKPYTRTLKK